MVDTSNSYLLSDPEHLTIESTRLAIQAIKLFQLESKALFQHLNTSSHSILDLGCGNGAFLRLLKQTTLSVKYIGIDRNEALLNQAKNQNPDIDFYKVDFSNTQKLQQLLLEHNPEYLICRFVFQHLSASQRSAILELMKKNKLPSSRVILADSDDDYLSFHPKCAAITELIQRKIEKQRNEGGNRTIGKTLSELLKEHGYQNIKENQIIFNHITLGWDVWEAIAWPVITEGITSSQSKADEALLSEGKKWFERAKNLKEYSASFRLFYASGM
jgi:ubiquinone/menaquinone biosynthesis C-methylase UbiE